jgi:hypothetical protein
MKPLVSVSIALALLTVPTIACGQDSQTYLYDANGRLIAATTARPTSGAYASYALDDADNRTARNAYATTGPTVAGKLLSGESLVPAQAITNGSYTLTLQTSGDLVVTGSSGVVQHSCTGTGRSLYARMETNGDFVVRDVAGAILWQSNTGAYSGAELFLNSDGTLAVKSGGVTRWSGTVTGGGCF